MRALAALAVATFAAPGSASATTIVSGPVVRQAPHQVTITWHTDVSASTEVAWDTQSTTTWGAMEQVSAYPDPAGTLHSRTLSNLPPGTYHHRVRSVDAGGNATTSAQATFTVAELDDLTPLGSVVLDGEAEVTAIDASRYYVGGSFTQVRPRRGHGVIVDPSTGSVHDGTPIVSGLVTSAVSDGAGGWYVGGYFRRVGAYPRSNLAHILPDGGVDPYFDVPVTGGSSVSQLLIDGSVLYLSGSFTSVDGQARNRLAAISTTTGSVTAWNPNVGGGVNDIAVDGGIVYAVGSFTTVNGATARNRAAAFDATTGVATAWNPNASGTVNAIRIDGGIAYLGGSFVQVQGGTTRNRVAAFDLVGVGALQAWNPNANGTVNSLAVDATAVYLGGAFTSINGATTRNRLASVDRAGGTATAFNPNVASPVLTISLMGGTVYAGGDFTTVNGSTGRRYVAAFATATGVASSWDPDPDGRVNVVAPTPDGILLGGGLTSVNTGVIRNRAAAFDLETNELLAWDPDLNGTVQSLAVDGDSVYLGGMFTTANGGTTRNRLAEVDATTGALTAWNPDLNSTAYAIAVTPTTTYVGGTFSWVNGGGTLRQRAAAFDRTTGIATAWDPNLNGTVNAIELDGATAYLGGTFTTADGPGVPAATRNRLVATNLTNGDYTGWNPSAGGDVYALLVHGSSLYVGGTFTTINGAAPRTRVAELSLATGTASAWSPNIPSGGVNGIAVRGDHVYLAGSFGFINGALRYSLGVVDRTSGATTPWNPMYYGAAKSIASADDTVVVAGYMSRANYVFANELPQHGFARYVVTDSPGIAVATAPSVATAPHQTTITWKTDVSGTTEVAWDTTSRSTWGGYANTSRFTGQAGTRHSRTLSHLRPDTYFYRVRSVAADGATVTSSEGSFTVDEIDGLTPLDTLVVNGQVLESALSADGSTYYMVGQFSEVGVRRGSGLQVDDTTGTVQDGLPQVTGDVRTVVPDGSGGWFIGGDFTRVGALPLRNAAHILPDGGVDPDWDADVNSIVHSIAVSGTTVYLGGGFWNANGSIPRNRAAAFDSTTGTLTAWNPSPNGNVEAIEVVGSTVYLGGSFSTVNGGTARGRAAAVDATSGVATGWDPNLNNTVRALEVVGTTVYLAGDFTTANGGTTRNRAAAVDTTTGTLTGWNPNLNNVVYAMSVSGTTIYLGGNFTSVGGTARSRLAAIDSAGTLLGWAPSTTGTVSALEASGPVVYVGGIFTTLSGVPRDRAGAVDAVTGVTTGWNPSLSAATNSIAAAGSSVFVGGSFATANAGVVRNNAAAIDVATGTLTAWDPDLNNVGYSIAVDGSTVYLGGNFTAANGGTARTRIAAVDATTGTLTPWNPDVNSIVYEIDVSGSTVYLGGMFTTAGGGTPRSRAAAFDATSGALTGWDPNLNNVVNALEVEGSTVYLGGTFTTANGGTARSRAAAVDATTGTLTGWNPNVNNSVSAILVSGSTVYLGGNFTSANGTPRNRAAAVDATTGAANGWNPNLSGALSSIAQSGSTIYLGGWFASANGLTGRSRLAAVDATTGTLTAWDPDSSFVVNSVVADGQTVLAAGTFSYMGEVSQQGFAHFENVAAGAISITDGPAVALAPHQTTITWTTDVSGTTEVAFDTASRASWGGYASKSRFTGQAGASHSRTLGHLPPDTYYYRVRSVTADGATATSGEGTFTVSELAAGEPLDRVVADDDVDVITPSGNDVYLGGDFTRISPRSGSAVVVDGGSGNRRSDGPIANGYVYASEPDGSGGFIIGGDFTRVGGHDRAGLARLLPDGGVDPDWNPVSGLNGYGDIAIDGGWVYVGGAFTTFGGSPRGRLARVSLATGAFDASWNVGAGFNGTVYDVDVVGGALYAAGSFTTFNGTSSANIAKLVLATATLDATFDPGTGFNAFVWEIEVSGGAIWAGGNFGTYNGTARSRVAKLDATTGALDATFNPGTGANNQVFGIALSGGSLYIAGRFTTYDGTARTRIARVNATTGALDAGFDPGSGLSGGDAYSIEMIGSDVLVGGSFATYDGATADHLVRIAPDAAIVAWGSGFGPDETVHTLAVDASSVLVGGYFAGWGGSLRRGIAKIDANGALDATFAPGQGFVGGVNGSGVTGIGISGGSLFVVGNFASYDGAARSGIAKLDATTAAIDGSFATGTGFTGSIWGASQVEVSGGFAYVVGSFTSYNGTTRNRAAKLNATSGALDATFNSGTGFNNSVYAIDVDGSSVYVGGSFTTYAGSTRTRAAKLTTSGALDGAFNTGTGFNSTVRDIEVEPEGVFVSGSFTNYGGVPVGYVAKLSTSGVLDASFAASADSPIRDIARFGSHLVLAGDMWSVNGNPGVRGIARVALADGSLDTSFLPSIGDNSYYEVAAAAVTADGRVLAGYRVQDDWVPQLVGSTLQSGFATLPWCIGATNCADVPEQISVSVDSPTLSTGPQLPEQAAFVTSTVTVTTNAFWGYSLSATDGSDTGAAACSAGSCSGLWIPDWTGSGATPSVWNAATHGYVGVTVRDVPASARLGKWGPGTGTAETDVVNNLYAGLDQSMSTLLHATDRYTTSAGQDHLVTVRGSATPTQAAGSYTATIALTAVANP